VKTVCNPAEFSKEGYGSKSSVLQMVVLVVVMLMMISNFIRRSVTLKKNMLF
jgi:hypothetical protein